MSKCNDLIYVKCKEFEPYSNHQEDITKIRCKKSILLFKCKGRLLNESVSELEDKPVHCEVGIINIPWIDYVKYKHMLYIEEIENE